MSVRIVFHGDNAACFHPGFAELVPADCRISVLPDVLADDDQRRLYAEADVIVAASFAAHLPRPDAVALFHVPGAGTDAVDFAALPAAATVCNCFGHEQGIAEYVFAGLLARCVPFADADARLRSGVWAYSSGSLARLHAEMAGTCIGLVGFGHIGKAVARRAKAFEMTVAVANRSPVAPSDLVDLSFGLDRLADLCRISDAIVVSLPLTAETAGIVGAEAFAAMKPNAVVINVGRGRTIDEQALFDALQGGRIGGAVIDTWYDYPTVAQPETLPSKLPFHTLPNIVMTPHMSGWTGGTIRRRQQTIADNINRLLAGEACFNVVRPGSRQD
jgi:phosphoglycerate dehydrogenase-like enzyme